jgi:protein-disulfide isomerase
MAFRSTKTLALVLISAAVGAGAGTLWSSLTPASAVATETPPFVAELGPDALTRGPSAVLLGNPRGDVTVIEFFDYQCPICRKIHPFVEQLVAEDGNIRLVHKHWPAFGGVSAHAARMALAARWQGRYEQFHDALMRVRGRIDEETVRQAAMAADVNLEQAARDLAERSAELDAAISEAAVQARSLQLPGTPGFVIGNYLVPGGLDLASLKEIVAEVRAKQSADRKG